MKKLILILFTAIILFSCDNTPNNTEYQKEVMVFGYLKGNSRVDADHAIFISNTQPLLEEYNQEEAAISGVEVLLFDSTADKNYTLTEHPVKKGFYYNDSILVQPNSTYHLTIRVDEKEITAKTTVPSDFIIETPLSESQINSVFPSTVSRQNPFIIASENPEQLIMVDVNCQEEFFNAEYIDPFGDRKYPETREEYDGGINGQPKHIFAIVPYKELEEYDESGRRIIDWYSSMIVFYGLYHVQVMAIDDNMNRYYYTENPVYNGGINGGLGVFGSYVGKLYRLQVVKE